MKRYIVVFLAGCVAACLAFARPDPSYKNAIFVAAGLGHDFGLIRSSGAVELRSHLSLGVQDREVVAFDIGFDHMTVLKKDGSVKTIPEYGKVGRVQPANLQSIVSVGCGDGYSIAIKSTGEIVVWGDPASSVIIAYNARKTELDGMKFKLFAAGAFHVLLLDENGVVTALGIDRYGECDIPKGQGRVRRLAAGDRCSLVLYEDGVIRAFGSNASGQLEIPKFGGRYSDIAAGMDHCLAVTDSGFVVGWGRPLYGLANPADVPVELRGIRFKSVLAKGKKSFALTESGDLYMWGSVKVRRKLDGD